MGKFNYITTQSFVQRQNVEQNVFERVCSMFIRIIGIGFSHQEQHSYFCQAQ